MELATETSPEPRTITVAHSPDSDDAFMFYGLATNKLETEGLKFEHTLKDIQTLNEDARTASTTLPRSPFTHTPTSRISMRCCRTARASATSTARSWSRKSRNGRDREHEDRDPGRTDETFLALRLFNSKFEYVVYPFDRIIEAVQKGKVDAGLLIHEGQLFYKELGLDKVLDLGEWWHEKTGLPLPMGGNAISAISGPS